MTEPQFYPLNFPEFDNNNPSKFYKNSRTIMIANEILKILGDRETALIQWVLAIKLSKTTVKYIPFPMTYFKDDRNDALYEFCSVANRELVIGLNVYDN